MVNRILIANGLLLLVFMGFHQWVEICNNPWILSHSFYIDPSRESVLGLGLALLWPLTLILLGKHKQPSVRKVITSLLILNPILFCLIPYAYQRLPHEGERWDLSYIAGPQMVGQKSIYFHEQPLVVQECFYVYGNCCALASNFMDQGKMGLAVKTAKP